VSMLLTVVLLMSAFVTPVAAGQGNGRGQERKSEQQIDAFWGEILREAEAAVTSEQIAEAYRIMEETEQFFSALSPESLWKAYLAENLVQKNSIPKQTYVSYNTINPDLSSRDVSEGELSETKREVKALYDEIKADNTLSSSSISTHSISTSSIATNYISTDVLLRYTRHFSGHDGVGVVGRTAIEASGNSALRDAAIAFPNEAMRQDAYRHYLWNFRAVRNSAVHLIQGGRINSTRIYTTNRELVTNILRRSPTLNVANPTPHQLATALNLRNNFFNRTLADWNALFLNAEGRDELMDLWNNEFGRRDGVTGPNEPLTLFNSRWAANTVIRSNAATDVTSARRQTIWFNFWYVPVR